MLRAFSNLFVPLLLTAALAYGGCHADDNDPVGQAEELADPVRRAHALQNLSRIYGSTLADASGDRSAAPVQQLADQIVPALTQTYVENTQDRTNGQSILDLLKEIQDPRSIPALTKALEWRTGVTEEHTIRSAQTLIEMEIPESEKPALATALAQSFGRINGQREDDNRMRIELIRAMGALHHTSVTPHLIEIMQSESEMQPFLVSRLAARELGELGDPAAVEAMIGALFRFAPNHPEFRMNDVASEALVRIGRPSLQPVIRVLQGQDAEANAAADALIAALRARNPRLQVTRAQVVGPEATSTLGMLGFAEAYEPLLAETRAEERDRKLNGALALTRLSLSEAQRNQVRTVLTELYGSFNDRQLDMKAQLMATMANTFDAGYMDIFIRAARDTRSHPALRETAAASVGKLGNAAQAEQIRTLIGAEEDIRQRWTENIGPYLDVARECDSNVACYIGKVGDENATVAEKAAYMIGLLANDNQEDAITALVGLLGHSEFKVRFAALLALDHIATSGSQAAVDRIEELGDQEQGRRIWEQFKGFARPIQARLRARAS